MKPIIEITDEIKGCLNKFLYDFDMESPSEILIPLLQDNKYKIGAELGVYEGDTTIKLLENLPHIEKYYCIDPWKNYKEYIETLTTFHRMLVDYDEIYIKACNNLSRFKEKVIIIREMSAEASKKIKDNSLDFIFIDGNHKYYFARNDIILYLPKVKKGGLICGHDYSLYRFGVIRAVNELLNEVKVQKTVWYTYKK